MRKSEIFESFVKIAEEKGLISDYSSEKARKTLENNPRMAALTAKDIEKLYNVKPETAKGMEYDKNISQLAHPEPVVVSNSYDKLNGLVENINERQNILLNIVNKPVNGLLTNHKYAEKELILSLVRLGNSLDNKNKDDLRNLADTCLAQVSTKIEKTAIAPLAWAAIVGIPALLAAIVAHQNLPNFDAGFEQNHSKLLSELDDFINSNSNFGVGVDYTESFKNTIVDFKNKLESFYTTYSKFKPIIDNFESPKDAKQLIHLAEQPAGTAVTQAYISLLKLFETMLPLINEMQKNFSSESYKARQVQDKGFFSSLIDKTQVLHGKNGLIADDFQDIINALSPYKQSVKDILNVFRQAQDMQAKAKKDLEAAAMESSDLFSTEKSVKDVDNEAGNLSKDVEDLTKDLAI